MRNMKNEKIPLTVANTIFQTNKQSIEADPNQMLRSAIQEQNLAPPGPFDIYNQFGQVISNDVAANYRDATVYIGLTKIECGSIPSKDFKQLSSGFPSIRHINQYSTDQKVGAFVVNLPGVVSHRDNSQLFYTVLVDARSFPELPSAYILSPSTDEIEHANIYQGSVFSVAPNKTMCAVCTGSSFNQDWASSICESNYSVAMMLGIYLDHIIHVLKNPNPDDPAREV